MNIREDFGGVSLYVTGRNVRGYRRNPQKSIIHRAKIFRLFVNFACIF
jgi:hypothetical protein